MLLFNKIQINFLEADSVSWISAGFPLTALNVFVAFCKKFGCIINPSVYGSLALFQRFFFIDLKSGTSINTPFNGIGPSLN